MELKELIAKELQKVSSEINAKNAEAIDKLKKTIADLEVKLSEKEVATNSKVAGVSREAKLVFGAYAKKMLGGQISDELEEKVASFSDAIEKDVILGSDANTGADLLHTQLHKGILSIAATYGAFVRNAASLRATEAVYRLVFEKNVGDNGSWIDEGSLISQDAIEFGARNVPLKTWRKMIGVSEQMLRNSAPVELGEYLISTLAKKFGLFIEKVGFDVVLASTGVIAVPANDAQGDANGLKNLSYKDLVKTKSAVPASVNGYSKWYVSPSVLGAIENISDNNNMPVFAVGNGNFATGLDISEQNAGRILARPVELSDALPTVADVKNSGDPVLVYGALGEAFAVITRSNFKVESNNGGKYFEKGIVAVRGTADAEVAELNGGAMAKLLAK